MEKKRSKMYGTFPMSPLVEMLIEISIRQFSLSNEFPKQVCLEIRKLQKLY